MSDSSDESEDEKTQEIIELMKPRNTKRTEDLSIEKCASLFLEDRKENKKSLDHKKNLSLPGEVCTQYIAQSNSDIMKHPFYKYPSIEDPGIVSALFGPKPTLSYHADGKQRYIASSMEINQAPVSLFHKNLLEKSINLSHYSITPTAIRAMATALENNTYVQILNFTENFLNDDACFHLGHMLTKNSTIQELNLEGCRMGLSGLKKIMHGLLQNKTLKDLNLSRNTIGDDGGKELGHAFCKGLKISKLYLSCNELGSEGASALADGFKINNKLALLDLSWNNFFNHKGLCKLLNIIKDNYNLETLNLSWNSLAGRLIGNSIVNVIHAPKLSKIDLSNNKLQGEVIDDIAKSLGEAKKLVFINLSFNPLSVDNAYALLSGLKSVKVKVQNLLMDDVAVNYEFITLLKQVKNLNFRKNTVVSYGEVKECELVKKFNPRDVTLNKVELICKNAMVDVALVVDELINKGVTKIRSKTLGAEFARHKVTLDDRLLNAIAEVFPGPKMLNDKVVNLDLFADYIKKKRS